MDSTRFILHHYESSPYAEKVRLLLSRGDIPWYSVLSPAMPPRPNVDPLTGGYRRIPVAQIGADLFCDTALIALEVAALTAVAGLSVTDIHDDVADLVARAEGDVFFAAITGASPKVVLKTLFKQFGLFGTIKFMRDRSGMMKSAAVRPPRGPAAVKLFNDFLRDLNALLAQRAFLSGTEPGYADFAVYHPIWLQAKIADQPLSDDLPHVKRWFAAVAATGHGAREELAAVHAFAAAADNDPRPLPDSEAHPLLNKQVSIGPSDYGQNPVQGELVAVTPERYVVARVTDRFGRLHVHFPRKGYSVVAM